MIRKLAEQVKEYKGASIATPLFMLLEVAMEMMIPLEMGNILDKGIQGNSLQAIFFYGGIMIPCRSFCRFCRRQVRGQGLRRLCPQFKRSPLPQGSDLLFCQY